MPFGIWTNLPSVHCACSVMPVPSAHARVRACVRTRCTAVNEGDASARPPSICDCCGTSSHAERLLCGRRQDADPDQESRQGQVDRPASRCEPPAADGHSVGVCVCKDSNGRPGHVRTASRHSSMVSRTSRPAARRTRGGAHQTRALVGMSGRLARQRIAGASRAWGVSAAGASRARLSSRAPPA